MTDHTDRIPRFVLEHIHNNGWTSFREVQLKAFDILFDTDDHILISSGTSSGKTEAAFIPVISSLHSDPPEGIGAMYVGPTKALIDDQFSRVDRMLRNSGIQVTGWHGDVGRNAKMRLSEDPRGIVQITPESLEGILDNYPERIAPMFGSLRFVIIDEIHSFMASDRGLQLMCELDRIERIAGCSPRRIGLSATVSDPSGTAEWMKGSTERDVGIVTTDDRRSSRIGIKYWLFPPKDLKKTREKAVSAYYSELFRLTDPYACIVFSNTRVGAERIGKSLKKVSDAKRSRNPVRVHHGSLSGSVRKDAENALRSGDNATVVATVTLELGVDIGDLDRVVQIDAPYSVSSLVQRMGRSGRRGGRQELVMFCTDDEAEWRPGIDGVSMELARGIAETELYLKEGWTEPIRPDAKPFGLLFHQTLAALKGAQKEMRFTDLRNEVLSLHPFAGIPEDDYRLLLKHMINQRTLMQTEDYTLLIGSKGEPVAFGKDFATVFAARKETEIRANGASVGTVQGEPEIGSAISLAGRTWLITARGDGWAEAIESDADSDNVWKSDPPDIDTTIMRKIRDVLLSDEEYPYLDSKAREVLESSRNAFRESGAGDVFVPTDYGYLIYPWLGSVQFDTLRRMLAEFCDIVYAYDPLVIAVESDWNPDEIRSELKDIRETKVIDGLMEGNDRLRRRKYDRFVPDSLLADAFCANRLDWDFEI